MLHRTFVVATVATVFYAFLAVGCFGRSGSTCRSNGDCRHGYVCCNFSSTHAGQCETTCTSTGTDAGAHDASVDAASDAAQDAATDAGLDAEVDAATDASLDADVDAAVDGAVDAGDGG